MIGRRASPQIDDMLAIRLFPLERPLYNSIEPAKPYALIV